MGLDRLGTIISIPSGTADAAQARVGHARPTDKDLAHFSNLRDDEVSGAAVEMQTRAGNRL